MHKSIIGIAMLIIAGTGAAETLWEWDFTSEPSGWTWTSDWDFNDSGAVLYRTISCRSITSLLSSDVLSVPASAAGYELEVSFDHYLDYLGRVYDCPMWTDIVARVILNNDTSYAFQYNEFVYAGVHSWDSLYTSDSGTRLVTVGPVQENDELEIQFYFYWNAYGSFHTLFMHWIVTDLKVETVGNDLSRYTWGALKSLWQGS